MKIDSVNYPLHLAMIFVFISTFAFVLTECGMFSMTNDQKLAKIEECTKNNYGIEYNYLFNGKVKEVGCCTKGQQYCNFNNLKSQK